MNRERDGQVKASSPLSARSFFREVARARRLKRRMLVELRPGSPWLDVLHGRAPGLGKVSRGLRPLPVAQAAGPDTGEGAVHVGEGGDLEPGFARSVIGWPVPKRIGLNMVREYQRYYDSDDQSVKLATCYGAGGEPLADVERLGGSMAWQVGGRDLSWYFILQKEEVTGEQDLLVGLPVPAFAELSSGTGSSATGDREARVMEQAELLHDAQGAGVKLVLTFLTRGSVGARPGCMPSSSSSCPGDGSDYFQSWPPSKPTSEQDALNPGRAIKLDWDEDAHEGQADTDGHSFPVHVTGASDDAATWHLASLDPTASYKRTGLRDLACWAAGIVQDALTEAEIGSVSDVVDAIDLFNEIERCSQFVFLSSSRYDHATSGMMWGRSCAWAASGIREVFPGSSPRIGLPGLLTNGSSDYLQAEARSWAGSKAHLQSLVRHYVVELLDENKHWHVGTGDLPDYLQCLDVHFHEEVKQSRASSRARQFPGRGRTRPRRRGMPTPPQHWRAASPCSIPLSAGGDWTGDTQAGSAGPLAQASQRARRGWRALPEWSGPVGFPAEGGGAGGGTPVLAMRPSHSVPGTHRRSMRRARSPHFHAQS